MVYKKCPICGTWVKDGNFKLHKLLSEIIEAQHWYCDLNKVESFLKRKD